MDDFLTQYKKSLKSFMFHRNQESSKRAQEWTGRDVLSMKGSKCWLLSVVCLIRNQIRSNLIQGLVQKEETTFASRCS